MITMPDLQTALLDLLHEVKGTDIKLIIGGQKCDPHIIEAGHLVAEHFSALNRPGMIRLRESPYYRPELQLAEFMSALQELFPVRGQPDLEGK